MKRIGFIGCGNIGGTLACAVAKTENEIFLADLDRGKLNTVTAEIGAVASDNETIAKTCDMIFLGVKPQVLGAVLGSLSDTLKTRSNRFVLVSMAAGTSIESICNALGCEYPVIRIMPNTPAAVGSGMMLYCKNSLVTDSDVEMFLEALKTAGKCDLIDEKLIDAASAVSGCGPAFVYMFIEALADGGVRCGLPRDKALTYAAQTVLGAGKMVLETGRHPGELKDAVCSPAGSTIEGVRALEQAGFRSACIEAVTAAFERTKELGKK